MKAPIDISEELLGVAPILSGLDKRNFYQVPEGYFAASGEHILAIVEDRFIEAALPPVLASLPRVAVHPEVPAAYFQAFGDRLMSGIHVEEVREELTYSAPALVSAPKTLLYTVPTGYFATLPDTLIALAEHESREHNSEIGEKVGQWGAWMERVWDAVLKPSHAFAFTCILAAAVLISTGISHSTLTPEEKIFAQMQQLPESEINQYMGRHRDDFDERTILQNINDIDFTHYFDKPENIPAHLKAIDAESQSITEEDIID